MSAVPIANRAAVEQHMQQFARMGRVQVADRSVSPVAMHRRDGRGVVVSACERL